MRITFPEEFNMATYFLDDRIKEGRGEKVAVYYEDRQYTYRDVQQMANRVGNVLLNLNVEMEDRVLEPRRIFGRILLRRSDIEKLIKGVQKKPSADLE